MVVAFGLILILMIGGAGTRLIAYLLLAASIPALIGYGFDRLARGRIGCRLHDSGTDAPVSCRYDDVVDFGDDRPGAPDR